MILFFHGWLRDLYGEKAEIKTEIPADAIEGFFSQQPDHPRDKPIEVVDFGTEELLNNRTETEVLHLIPAMFGGGSVEKILLGGALIVGAFLTAGAGGIFASALSTSLFVNGALLVLSGVFSLFLKAPTSTKSEDPPPSKYLGVNENTTEQGTRKIIAVGEIAIAGHWLSLQSDSDKLVSGQFPENPS